MFSGNGSQCGSASTCAGGVVVDGPPRGNPALGQKRAVRQADLYRVEPEDVGHRAIEPCLLAGEEVMAERRTKPFGERR